MKEYIVQITDEDYEKSFWLEASELDVLDSGELIRCKDCKHGSIYMTEDVCGTTLIECNHPELGDTIAIHAWDWFCADGEHK